MDYPGEDNGPREDTINDTDPRLRRYVLDPPPAGAIFMDCDEADELPDDESCLGCPGWGYECWAWWLPPQAPK